MIPKNQLFLLLETPNDYNNSRKYQSTFGQNVLDISRFGKFTVLKMLEKAGTDKKLTILSIFSENLESGINLHEKHELEFGNMGSKSIINMKLK